VILFTSIPCDEYVYVLNGTVETGGQEWNLLVYPAHTKNGPHKAITNAELVTVRLGPMGVFDHADALPYPYFCKLAMDWIALLEKEIPFELVSLNLDGDQFQLEFLTHPFHQVPVLVMTDLH